jgi:hypothetical protein
MTFPWQPPTLPPHEARSLVPTARACGYVRSRCLSREEPIHGKAPRDAYVVTTLEQFAHLITREARR